MKIITVTGTKGKTTVTRVLSNVIHSIGNNTLRVDTDGYYINEIQKGDLEESKAIFSCLPTVSPGKYILSMKKYYPNFIAILEAALGSSAAPGLGYGRHDVGIFTNVLEDHLGVTKRLKRRIDLLKAKKFIAERIGDGGYFIFNADDKYVVSCLKYLPEKRNITLIPVGLKFRYYDINKHIRNGDKIITIDRGAVVIKSKQKIQKIINLKDIYWTFEGYFLPSVYNLMLIVAGLFALQGEKINGKIIKALKKYKFPEEGGRLTVFKNKKGTKIILDYAHEKYSLAEIAKLARKMAGKKGETFGILRLAPDRTDKMIHDTGMHIANSFDNIVIYDKIDGITKKQYIGKKTNIVRGIGEVSNIFFDGVKKNKKSGKVERIIIEEKAIEKTSKLAEAGDVVIIICGDNHANTVKWIKKYFGAKPV
jgi:cyanophycin synthetase